MSATIARLPEATQIQTWGPPMKITISMTLETQGHVQALREVLDALGGLLPSVEVDPIPSDLQAVAWWLH